MQASGGGFDFDWLVVGSGFGGSVSTLRLAEKGYKVAVLERGRRFAPETLPRSTWDFRNFFWLPRLGLRGITRVRPFRHAWMVSASGVGGGSLNYAATLYRAPNAFFRHPQWAGLEDWQSALAPHYDSAEKMLGVQTVPFESDGARFLKEVGQAFGVQDTFRRTPCGVYFGEPGKAVADPYFGGKGPQRSGCTRCGACMVGCRVGAKNTLDRNYLWLAERKGATILPEHFVTDIRPIGAADGSDGYFVTTERPGAWLDKRRRQFRCRGVVVAAGAVETNRLLLHCRTMGSLPAISDLLGTLVRTNSESILAVKMPANTKLELWRDVGNSASIFTSPDTHVEFCTYGEGGDAMATFFTLMVGKGTSITRPLKLLGSILRHPIAFLQTLWPIGWSRRTAVLLVMQSLDNAISFKAHRRLFGNGIRVTSKPDPLNPAPSYIEAAQRVASWLAKRHGAVAQSALPEALLNVPSTSHILGGAPIGRDATTGVLDRHNRVFGYENLLVCCGAAMPANPGVNPALTITALAEHAMSKVPPAAGTPSV